jgi:mevalonate kinase
VYYTQAKGPEPFDLTQGLRLVIGDTGIRSLTREAVGRVREAWEKEPAVLESLFDQIGSIVIAARAALQRGRKHVLAELMDQNQVLLEELKVGAEPLRELISAAKRAGALGGKLSGAGLGGIMIAIPPPSQAEDVESALRRAGAVWTYLAEVGV